MIPWRSSRIRVWRVSSHEHRVRRGQLLEHAERDVGEVADRGRADGERHALPLSVERLERRRAPRRSGRPRRRARPRRSAASRRRAGSPRPAPRSRAGSSTRSPAAAPKPPPTMTTSGSKMLTSEPIAAPSSRPISRERRHRAGIACSRALRRAPAHRRPARRASQPPGPPRAPTRAPRDGRGRGSSPGTAGRLRRRPTWPSSAQPR